MTFRESRRVKDVELTQKYNVYAFQVKYKTIDTPKIDNILKIYFDVCLHTILTYLFQVCRLNMCMFLNEYRSLFADFFVV